MGFFARWFGKRQRLISPLELADYVPNVTNDDVLRVINREFPYEKREAVIRVLKEYGTERWHREIDRVQLAVLKLSHGNIAQVKHYVDIAKNDYRDVVLPAESPAIYEVMCKGRGQLQMPAEEARRIVDDDREQYESWLRGASV